MVSLYSMTTSRSGAIDQLDAALIELLAAEPRVGVLEASRRLGAARGTVQARLDRMQDRGVITGYGPDVDPAALGYEVTAFITLEIRQAGGHDPVADRLAAIPEVLEVHTITGAGDMLCRVVARTNADLQRVLDAIVSAEGVVRSATLISLAAQVPYRILRLVRAAASGRGPALMARAGSAQARCVSRFGYSGTAACLRAGGYVDACVTSVIAWRGCGGRWWNGPLTVRQQDTRTERDVDAAPDLRSIGGGGPEAREPLPPEAPSDQVVVVGDIPARATWFPAPGRLAGGAGPRWCSGIGDSRGDRAAGPGRYAAGGRLRADEAGGRLAAGGLGQRRGHR